MSSCIARQVLSTILDHFTRERIAIEVGQRFTGHDVARILTRVEVDRRRPDWPALLRGLLNGSGRMLSRQHPCYDGFMSADVCDKLGAALADRNEVAVAYLFGSAAREDTSALSDIDVGVLLADHPHNLLRYRARLIEDLSRALEGRAVDVVLLDEALPALAARVIREGQLLLCRDDVRRVRFEVRALRRDFDTAPLRQIYDRTLANAIRQGRFYG
jgi:predicted nucleotidyltransferase